MVHLKGLHYFVAVGTECERLDMLRRDADIYIINREKVAWIKNSFDDLQRN